MITLLVATIFIAPVRATQPVANDPDDPAIWRNRRDPAKSLVFGTNKVKKPDGAIYAFDLKGKIVQVVTNVDRPNNIDVLYDLATPRGFMDVAIATERKAGQLRIFGIDPDSGRLTDLTGKTDVVGKGMDGVGEPMGIVAFRRGGKSYAVVSPKSGPPDGYLEEYELLYNGLTNCVDSHFRQRYGAYSGTKEIESLAYDSATDYVYYSDERFGTRRTARAAHASTTFRVNQDFQMDQEGLDFWRLPNQPAYLVCTDQLPKDSMYRVRDAKTMAIKGQFSVGADSTDGICIESRPLGPEFPRGLMVVMDSENRRFLYVDWRDVEEKLGLPHPLGRQQSQRKDIN
jgi:3-phytase